MTSHIGFPFTAGPDGRTTTADRSDHIRQMIEVTLFTLPGERVNRPEFGCGLQQMVFEGVDEPVATATTAMVQGALQQSLRELIEIRSVEVHVEQSTMQIDVSYIDLATRLPGSSRIERQA